MTNSPASIGLLFFSLLAASVGFGTMTMAAIHDGQWNETARYASLSANLITFAIVSAQCLLLLEQHMCTPLMPFIEVNNFLFSLRTHTSPGDICNKNLHASCDNLKGVSMCIVDNSCLGGIAEVSPYLRHT
ncbi:hypothetical protein JKP88DRAFT_171617 [Tribonema minus]|uniref:Uncharacterized protein n=1 Tax=Tribonema minus TaxID=303371 RepID=A0A836C7R0_9STRA|nr:hypothetical protein JKP88DRAFT_171617 [Tribonema minus]